MITKTITIKSNLSKHTLRQHISVFFKNTKFKTQYIYILIKITSDAGQNDFILGNKILLDLKNKDQIKTYKSIIVRKFLSINTQHKIVASDALTFFYVGSDKAAYDKYMEEVAKANNFNLDPFLK